MYVPGRDAYLFLVLLGGVWLMVVVAVQKGALEWRRRTRICPSCGRDAHRCRCSP